MFTLDSLAENDMLDQFSNQGVCIENGPFNLLLKSDNKLFCRLFRSIYGQSPLISQNLKGWMARFHGVATKNLPNYLGWRRCLEYFGNSLTA